MTVRFMRKYLKKMTYSYNNTDFLKLIRYIRTDIPFFSLNNLQKQETSLKPVLDAISLRGSVSVKFLIFQDSFGNTTFGFYQYTRTVVYIVFNTFFINLFYFIFRSCLFKHNRVTFGFVVCRYGIKPVFFRTVSVQRIIGKHSIFQ